MQHSLHSACMTNTKKVENYYKSFSFHLIWGMSNTDFRLSSYQTQQCRLTWYFKQVVFTVVLVQKLHWIIFDSLDLRMNEDESVATQSFFGKIHYLKWSTGTCSVAVTPWWVYVLTLLLFCLWVCVRSLPLLLFHRLIERLTVVFFPPYLPEVLVG